ncbi:MAG: dinitrogenase iron-molybdenum cofactor biosynthesis protein [Chitinivibrionales bacterium]|nr:dinitrogenase iron-molybdenum cofactor biosynthesis protein [Chitinivibrionales bacterium]
MKIAVTSTGRTSDSDVDQRFGRAACFLIFDTDTGAYQTLDNAQNYTAAQGAGIQAAQTIASTGVDVLITGHCGPKAFKALRAANIAVITGVSGTIEEAVEHYKGGELKEAAGADVEGHW